MKLSAPIYLLKKKAKRLSRDAKLPLHQALDQIAASEGFAAWGLLAAKASEISSAERLYNWLEPGELLLLGARPGQGKTLMGLHLAIQAANAGHCAMFFTLEYSERQVRERLRQIGAGPTEALIAIDCSDDIGASYVAKKLSVAASGTLAVIDYLQLLDQKRDQPALMDQVQALRSLSKQRGLIVVFISQVGRSYDESSKPFPDLTDIRLPNPLDLTLFDKSCFLNNGSIRFGKAA